MNLVSSLIFASFIIVSVVTSFENVDALSVSATQDPRRKPSYTAPDHSHLAQIRSSSQAVLKEPFKKYTDEDVTNNPKLFKNVVEYELLQALNSEGIDWSENVLLFRTDTKYRRLLTYRCLPIPVYLYYRCTDPKRKAIRFKEYRGRGSCSPRRTRKTNSRKYSKNILIHFTHRRTYSTYRQTYSSQHRGHSTFQSPVRYMFRMPRTLTGYRYLRAETTEICPGIPRYGSYVLQVVSKFVLKGKKARYNTVIDNTFRRIWKRYRGFQYVVSIQSETCEKNGNVHAWFSFNQENTRQAEH